MSNTNTSVKRAVISYENMSQELLDAFKEKYPRGYADYLSDIIKVDKPDGSYFHAVSLEVPGAIYLVKIKVKEDNLEDLQNDLFKDDAEDEEREAGEEDGEFPVNEGDMDGAQSDEAEAGSDE